MLTQIILPFFLSALLLPGGIDIPLFVFGQENKSQQEVQSALLPKGSIARLGATSYRHWQPISATAFSPKGDFLATAALDDMVRIWETKSGKAVARIQIRGSGSTNSIESIRFSPDGRKLAVGADNGIWLWDWRNESKGQLFASSIAVQMPGNRLKTLLGVRSVAFSPNGVILACCDIDGNVRLWDIKTIAEILRIPGEKDPEHIDWMHHPMVLSPSGETIAFASLGHEIRICSINSGKELFRLRGHKDRIRSLNFSPNGKALGSLSEDGRLCIWDVTNGKETVRHEEGTAGWDAFVFSPDGKSYIAGDAAGGIRIRDTITGKVIRELLGRSSGISNLAVSPDSKLLVAGGEDEALWRWNLQTGRLLSTEAAHHARVGSVAFAPDGKSVATASDDNTARLWEVPSGKHLTCFRGHTEKVYRIAYSPDGKECATVSCQGEKEGSIRLWQAIPNGTQTRVLPSAVNGGQICYCNGGQILAILDAKNDWVRLWDRVTEKYVGSIPSHGGLPNLAAPPLGNELLVADDDFLVIWNLDERQEVQRISEKFATFTSPAYSADGRMIAVGDGHNSVIIYEAASGKLIARSTLKLKTPVSERVRQVAFVARGKIVAAGTSAGRIYLWDLAINKIVAEWDGDCGEIHSLACSPDGKLLASGNADTTALLWKVPNDSVLTTGNANHENQEGGPSQTECKALWDQLKSEDVSAAYSAIWTLVRHARQTVPFLDKQVNAVAKPEMTKIHLNLVNLGSNEFAKRQQATEAIKAMSEFAIPNLRRRLAENPPLDERQRINLLLKEAIHLTNEQLRYLRAIQVLEYVGNREAKQGLQRLANGASESRLTQAAKATLERLRFVSEE
jgi:WD40 repeat protein